MPADDIEPFAVPEYFITECIRREIIPGTGCARLYYGTKRGTTYRAEYSVIIPIPLLATLGRDIQAFAAEAHNETVLSHMSLDGSVN